MIKHSTTHPFPVRLLRRFIAYSTAGTSSFLIDLLIIFVLVSQTDIAYPYAVMIGFIVGTLINFSISYRFVYRGTERSLSDGFIIFFLTVFFGAVLMSTGTYVLVEKFAINIYFARLSMAMLSGCINFIIHTFVNFKVV